MQNTSINKRYKTNKQNTAQRVYVNTSLLQLQCLDRTARYLDSDDDDCDDDHDEDGDESGDYDDGGDGDAVFRLNSWIFRLRP